MKARDIKAALARDPSTAFTTAFGFNVRGLAGGERGAWTFTEKTARHGPAAGEWERAGPSPSWHWAVIDSRDIVASAALISADRK